MPTAAGYTIRYSASGSRPFVDARLEIAVSGEAELYLGSSASLPPGGSEMVGFFAGVVDPKKLADLHSYITRRKLAGASATAVPTAPEMTVRTLVFIQGQQETTIEIADDSNNALKGVEERLLAIMADLSQSPVRALRADLSLTKSANGAEPVLTLAQLGSEPLTIELFDPAVPQRFVRIQLEIGRSVALPSGGSMWQPLSTVNLNRDQIAALVGSGEIPSGAANLSPGANYRTSLPDTAKPAANDAQAAVTVQLRISGPSGDWRNITLRSTPVKFP